MAFTVAHVVAVLPGLRPLRRWAPTAVPVLVAAAMAPDFPYYVRLPVSREQTHSLLGVLGVDAVLAVVAGLLWMLALARPLCDLAPEPLRRRLAVPAAPRLRMRDLPVWYAAAVAGASTHLVWDGLTHRDGIFVRGSSLLLARVDGVPVFQLLQLGSSALALAYLGLLAVRWFVRSEPQVRGPRAAWAPLAWVGAVAGAAAGAAYGAVITPAGPDSGTLIWFVLTRSVACSIGLTGLSCAVWWLLRPVTRAGSGAKERDRQTQWP